MPNPIFLNLGFFQIRWYGVIMALAVASGFFVFYKLDSLEEYEDILKNCSKYNLELVLKYSYYLSAQDIKRTIYILRKK